jgi:ATP-dependent RNA helicase DeaD
MEALDGQFYKGREVRCNDADQGGARSSSRGNAQKDQGGARSSSRGNAQKDQGRDKRRAARGRREDADLVPARKGKKKDDWRQFFQGHDIILKGDEPDFSEEGWARRKPKKKK